MGQSWTGGKRRENLEMAEEERGVKIMLERGREMRRAGV